MKVFVLTVMVSVFLSSCSSWSEKPDERSVASDKSAKTTKTAVPPKSKYDNTAQKFVEEPALIVCHDMNGNGLNDFRIKYIAKPITTAVTLADPGKKTPDGQVQIFANGGQYTYGAHLEKKAYVITMSDVGFDHFIKAISSTSSTVYKTDKAPTDVRFSLSAADGSGAQLSIRFADAQSNLTFGCGALTAD